MRHRTPVGFPRRHPGRETKKRFPDAPASMSVKGFSTEFADLLADGDAAVTPAGQAEGQGSDRREPASKEAESQPALSEGAKWTPE